MRWLSAGGRLLRRAGLKSDVCPPGEALFAADIGG